MLADVMKQRKKEINIITQEEMEKFNHPYKRDTIIYFDHVYTLGGIQTWINNLSLKYEFSVLYDRGDSDRIKYLESLGIECIRNVGQEIECNTLIRCMWGNPNNLKAKETILVVHGDYSKLIFNKEDVPKHDKVVAVSKDSAIGWKKYYGEDAEVIYNPVNIFESKEKPLIIGCFSRLSQEKGKWRYKYLIQELKNSKRDFLMLFFTDFPFNEDSDYEEDSRVIFFKPIMNPIEWMKKCDYIALLSDTEACPYNVLESMKLSKPMIITKLPILEEMGVNSSNAKILDFDMRNLDIDDLWNIPVVKNWKEPNSKGWEKYMKKKVFRERYVDEEFINWSRENGTTKAIIFEPTFEDGKLKLEKEVIAIKPKKTTKKKVGK